MPLASGGPGKRSPLLRGPLGRDRPFLQPSVALYEAIGEFADAATLVDAISTIVVQLSLSDTAAVADTLATLQAGLALTDTALGTDALATIQAALALTDTVSTVDALQTLMAALSLSDSASVLNAVSTIQAGLALADTATVANVLSTIQAGLALADTALGTDAISAVAAALALTDAATVANAISTIQAALGTADAGTAADALAAVLAALGMTDAAVTPYYTEVLADAPLGFWKLAGNSAADASGNGHNGTATGTAAIAGRGTATAMDFDGVDDFVSLPIDLSTHPTITLEFWAKVASFPGGDKLFAEYTVNYNGGGGFLVDPNVGPNGMTLNMAEAGYDTLSSVSPSDGALHQYVCVFDRTAAVGSQIKLYKDGVDTGAVDSGFDITGNFANDTLYLMSRGGASLFNVGQMQDVSVYNGILSQARITAHYNASPVSTWVVADVITTVRAALTLTDAAATADAISTIKAAFSAADVNFAAVVAADAPLSFWRFDEGTDADGTVRTDFMGAYNLTTIGPGDVVKAGVTGQGSSMRTSQNNLAANGQARSAGDIYAFNGNAPFTIETWFWPPTGMATNSQFLIAGGGNAWTIYTGFADVNGHPAIGYSSPHVGNGTAIFGMVMDAWNQFVVTFDGVSIRYYLNGALVYGPAASLAPNVDDLVSKFSVGALPAGNGESNMWADEVAVWGSEITAAQVARHYSAGTSPVTATVTEAVAIAALVVKNFTDSATVTDTMTRVIDDTEYKVQHSITPVTGMGPAASFEKWLDELQRARKKKEAEQAAIAREAAQRAALEKYAEEQRAAAYARNVGALLYYVKTGRLTKAQFLATVAREQHKWARVA